MRSAVVFCHRVAKFQAQTPAGGSPVVDAASDIESKGRPTLPRTQQHSRESPGPEWDHSSGSASFVREVICAVRR
jgi:hypothetical protein